MLTSAIGFQVVVFITSSNLMHIISFLFPIVLGVFNVISFTSNFAFQEYENKHLKNICELTVFHFC